VLLIEVLSVLLLADAVSGLVHWAEDSFWNESTPVLGRWIVQPNVVHHRNGAAFVANSWLESSWDLLGVGILTLLVAWALDCLTWHVWLFVLLGVNANQIHKWNHMPRHRVPLAVRTLRVIGVLQSMKHHANHHRGAKNTHYCVITPFLNPLLDRLGFWRFLERMLLRFLPAPRRTDLNPC
jgi:hypothetical protein